MAEQCIKGASVWLAGTKLVKRAIEEMIAADADEVVLEAEVTNSGALALYRNLGFLRDKRLIRCASYVQPCPASTCSACKTMDACVHCVVSFP